MAKTNNGTLKWVISVIMIITTLLTIGGWIATTQKNIESVQTAIIEINENGSKVARANEKDIIVIKSDVKYIRKGVDENTVTQKEILLELKK